MDHETDDFHLAAGAYSSDGNHIGAVKGTLVARGRARSLSAAVADRLACWGVVAGWV
jgi:hypothetical protein